MTKLWQYQPMDATQIAALKRTTGLDELFCQLLLQRNITTAEEAALFFQPSVQRLHTPFAMKNMLQAVGRVNQAIEQQEPILIYGDYDVDGVCGVAMMYTFLADHLQQIIYYIPDRYREGYGISTEGIHYAIDKEIKLIIAIDCGIRAVEQVALANQQGIDVIICDHHLPPDELPDAFAILNPLQRDCDYPFKSLCGCGVAFKLIQALARTLNLPDPDCLHLLDFVATATCCDIVPLRDENRILVAAGLQRLDRSGFEGFRALLSVSKRTSPLSVNDLVFGLGPMINAAGRLGDAREAVQLLLADNRWEANNQAMHLQRQNELRKTIDRRTVKEAISLLEKEKTADRGIVLFQPQWHKGIVGIVAGRLVEKYQKPTIILAESAGNAVGSARSVTGVDISQVIGHCDDLLLNYGGHQHAAGLTLPIENVPLLKKRIEALLQSHDPAAPTLTISAKVALERIDRHFFQVLQQFAPFGPGNRNPVLATTGVSLYGTPRLLKKSHVQFEVTHDGSAPIKCIAFNQPEALAILQEESPFDISYHVQENNWNNMRRLQLNIKAVRRTMV